MTHFRQLADHELEFLGEFVEVVDHRLDSIEREIAAHHDPDSYGLIDVWESTSRIGFVLCQNYLYDVLGRREGRERQRCFDLGPSHARGVSYAAIINAAGNFVKHHQEAEPLNRRHIDVLRRLGVWGRAYVDEDRGRIELDEPIDYPMGNLFHTMMDPTPNRFVHVMPLLQQWRDAVIETVAEPAAPPRT